MTDNMPTLEYFCPVHQVHLPEPHHYVPGVERQCQAGMLTAKTLTRLLVYRVRGEFDLAVSPDEATHQMEIVSGRIIKYTHGDKEPEGFNPRTQFWVKVRKKY